MPNDGQYDLFPPIPYLPSPLSLPVNNIATGPAGAAQGGQGTRPPTATTVYGLPEVSSSYAPYAWSSYGGLGMGAAANNATYRGSEQRSGFTYGAGNLPTYGAQSGMTYNANNMPDYNHNPNGPGGLQQGQQQYQNSERGGPTTQTQYQQSERTRTAATPGHAVVEGINPITGLAQPYYIPPGASNVTPPPGMSEADYMAQQGYVPTTNGGWTMGPTQGQAAAKSNTWYGGQDARLGGGYRRGGIYLSSFATEQAYQTWARSKRLEAKKAAEGEKKVNAASVAASYSAGTG